MISREIMEKYPKNTNFLIGVPYDCHNAIF